VVRGEGSEEEPVLDGGERKGINKTIRRGEIVKMRQGTENIRKDEIKSWGVDGNV